MHDGSGGTGGGGSFPGGVGGPGIRPFMKTRVTQVPLSAAAVWEFTVRFGLAGCRKADKKVRAVKGNKKSL